jgi:hypothetical protein
MQNLLEIRGGKSREQGIELFNADRLTPEKIGALMVEADEHPNAFKNRLMALVDTWIQDGDLIVPQRPRPVPSDANKCEWWATTRVAPFENTPEGFNSYMVSIPRVSKSEAPEEGPRPFVNVQAPKESGRFWLAPASTQGWASTQV